MSSTFFSAVLLAGLGQPVMFDGGWSGYGAPAWGYGYGAPVYSSPAYSRPIYSTPVHGASVYSSAVHSYDAQGYGASTPSMSACPLAGSGGYAGGAPMSFEGGYAAGPSQGYGQHSAAYGPPGGRAGSGGPAVVHMTDKARFEPALVTIKAGETVEWRNASRHPHTVTLDPTVAKNPAHIVLPEGAEPFDSGEIAPGGGTKHTFDVPGTYFYVCAPHEEKGMVGIVVVEPAEGPSEPAPPRAEAEALPEEEALPPEAEALPDAEPLPDAEAPRERRRDSVAPPPGAGEGTY